MIPVYGVARNKQGFSEVTLQLESLGDDISNNKEKTLIEDRKALINFKSSLNEVSCKLS
jgi:hypothetical protein